MPSSSLLYFFFKIFFIENHWLLILFYSHHFVSILRHIKLFLRELHIYFEKITKTDKKEISAVLCLHLPHQPINTLLSSTNERPPESITNSLFHGYHLKLKWMYPILKALLKF